MIYFLQPTTTTPQETYYQINTIKQKKGLQTFADLNTRTITLQ